MQLCKSEANSQGRASSNNADNHTHQHSRFLASLVCELRLTVASLQDIKKSGGRRCKEGEAGKDSEKVDFDASFRLRSKLQEAIMEER
jgi:hypothetical protein